MDMNLLIRKINGFLRLVSSKINIRGGFFGIYFVPNHFYFPIPDFKRILKSKDFFNYKYLNDGLNLNIEFQKELILSISKASQNFNIADNSKADFFNIHNGMFGHDDSVVYFGIITKYSPSTIIEVGAGFNTLVSISAAKYLSRAGGREPSINVIEPYPSQTLKDNIEKINLTQQKVEDVPLSFFQKLERNDILFIDSSHVIKTRNDVVYLYLEVLPRLNSGVIVHIHDISIPYEIHPAIFRAGYSWNEQYLLLALLSHSSRYRIVYSGYYFTKDFYKEFKSAFPLATEGKTGGSFYIQVI